jgi:hypothetical protein
MGRFTSSPPQLGHIPCNLVAAQLRQKVHSKEQIIASAESGGRLALQHSQLGLSCNMQTYDDDGFADEATLSLFAARYSSS